MKTDMKNKKIIESYDYLTHSASSHDMTGLIPTPAKTKSERESYQELYPFEPEPAPEKE